MMLPLDPNAFRILLNTGGTLTEFYRRGASHLTKLAIHNGPWLVHSATAVVSVARGIESATNNIKSILIFLCAHGYLKYSNYLEYYWADIGHYQPSKLPVPHAELLGCTVVTPDLLVLMPDIGGRALSPLRLPPPPPRQTKWSDKKTIERQNTTEIPKWWPNQRPSGTLDFERIQRIVEGGKPRPPSVIPLPPPTEDELRNFISQVLSSIL